MLLFVLINVVPIIDDKKNIH